MPSSANKGLETQVTGSNAGTWGDVLNANVISYLDTMLGGITSLSLSSSAVLLTQAQARNALLRLTGTLLSAVDISPDSGVLLTGFVYWENLTSGSFAVTFSNSAGSVTLPQSRRGILWVDTTNGPRIVGIAGSSSADPVPVGTAMLFYQNAAPTGWTISAAVNDAALKIVSSAGGGTSGTVAYSVLFARTATDGHALTVAELAPHTHDIGMESQSNYGGGVTAALRSNSGATFTSKSTGSGDAHTHALDMRVLTAAVIIAIKT